MNELAKQIARLEGGKGCREMKPTISLDISNILDDFDGACVRMSPWVLVIETIHICHEEEHIGVNHGRCDSGQGVVVAELDFRDSQGVILIDNGNDTHVKKL